MAVEQVWVWASKLLALARAPYNMYVHLSLCTLVGVFSSTGRGVASGMIFPVRFQF